MGTEKERQRCVFWNNHSSDRVEESATSHLPPSSPHFISLHPWIQLHLQTLHPFISSLFLSRVPFLLCLTISSALSLSFCHYLSLLHPLLTLFFTLFLSGWLSPSSPYPPPSQIIAFFVYVAVVMVCWWEVEVNKRGIITETQRQRV